MAGKVRKKTRRMAGRTLTVGSARSMLDAAKKNGTAVRVPVREVVFTPAKQDAGPDLTTLVNRVRMQAEILAIDVRKLVQKAGGFELIGGQTLLPAGLANAFAMAGVRAGVPDGIEHQLGVTVYCGTIGELSRFVPEELKAESLARASGSFKAVMP